jgi:hypothetical protein
LVLVHDSDADATANVDRLRRRIAEGRMLPDIRFADEFRAVDISSQGRVLTAVLHSRSRFSASWGEKPLLLHE